MFEFPLPTDSPFIKLSAEELKFRPLSPFELNIFPPLPKIELLLEGNESIENVPIGKLLLLLLLLLLLELLVISRGAGDVGVSDGWLPNPWNNSREKSEKSKKDAEIIESKGRD